MRFITQFCGEGSVITHDVLVGLVVGSVLENAQIALCGRGRRRRAGVAEKAHAQGGGGGAGPHLPAGDPHTNLHLGQYLEGLRRIRGQPPYSLSRQMR
jgi:hypothetical protein